MTKKFLVPIVLPADPAAAMEAATKQYVDGKIPTVTTSAAAGFAANYGGGVLPASIYTPLYVGTASIAQGFTHVGQDKVRCDVAGRYLVTGNFTFTGTAGTYVIASLAHWRGGAVIANRDVVVANATAWRGGSASHLLDLQVGDQVAWSIAPDSGVTMDARSWLSITGAGTTNIFGSQWNSAWGVVAQATMKTSPVAAGANVWTAISNPLSFAMRTGRRYAIRGNARAFQTAAGGTGTMVGIFRDGVQAWDNHQNISRTDAYNHAVITAYVDGDGVTRSYDMRFQPSNGAATVHTDQATGFFLIEDVGPVSGAVPVENPTPAWIPLPYAASWQSAGNGPGYRKIGDIVYLQGGVQWTGGSVADGSQLVCTLPVGYWPAYPRRFTVWLNNTGVAKRATVATNGQVTIDTPLTTNHSWELSLIFSVTP